MLQMQKPWYNFKWTRAGFHILAWLVLFMLPLLSQTNNHGQHIDWRTAILNTGHIVFTSLMIICFYLNANFLIPVYLNKRRIWQYLLLLLALLMIWVVAASLLFGPEKAHAAVAFHRESLWVIFPFLFMWSMGTVYRIVSDKVKTDQLIKEKENENLKTELSFLRSQVSPHFLFNVLNNMVALARLKSDRLEPSLIKLSGLMRYMLYESDEQKVPLEKEVEYVSSYIDLQKLRFGKDMKIQVRMEEFKDGQYLIEPMLLIPFIENAFKHGTGLIDQPEIDIALSAGQGMLEFCVKNKYDGDSNEIKDKTSGIGLNNVSRRLNLLYDKRHSLAIEKENGWFVVFLQLKLQ
jgi:two-component system LytT family sensor kinase